MQSPITPASIFIDFYNFVRTRALDTAIELEIFTHIADGRDRVEELTTALEVDPERLRILLDGLCSMGYLSKSEGRYSLVPVSETFLVKGKPAYQGGFFEQLQLLWEPVANLTQVIKTGQPHVAADEQEVGPEFFIHMVDAIFGFSYETALLLGRHLGLGETWRGLEILDVAAGSGVWGLGFASLDPTSRVMAIDWPKILDEVMKKHVAEMGLEKQFSYMPGNLRQLDFGQEKYDLVMVGYVCCTEGAEASQDLMAKAYRALKKGGKLVVADIISDDERKEDSFSLILAVSLTAGATHGNALTAAECRQWLTEIGFKEIEVLEISPPFPLIVAVK